MSRPTHGVWPARTGAVKIGRRSGSPYSGVEATVPRHTILSASSITAIDVSFSDTSRKGDQQPAGERHDHGFA
jgi:hypothetical protein